MVFKTQNTQTGSVKLEIKLLPLNPAAVVTHGGFPLFACAQFESASDLCKCLLTLSAAASCALSAENTATTETKCCIAALCLDPVHSAC